MSVLALEGKSNEELLAIIAKMQSASARKLTLKVTAPSQRKDGTMTSGGAISLYGLGRFPVTLYASQWERVIGEVEHIKAFIETNRSLLATKD